MRTKKLAPTFLEPSKADLQASTSCLAHPTHTDCKQHGARIAKTKMAVGEPRGSFNVVVTEAGGKQQLKVTGPEDDAVLQNKWLMKEFTMISK